jgi:Na+-translocating ferredoxin:NAD+ oxidoreductase RnfG subunit
MVYFYRSPQAIVISAICTIAVAAFIYFVMVKPQTDHANRQVDHALKQIQPSIDNANKQFKSAQPSVNKAQKIQDCVLAAGTDPQKLAACNK